MLNTARPFNVGFCDGLFDRECRSPWRTWAENHKSIAYVQGYMEGEKARKAVITRIEQEGLQPCAIV